EQLKKLSRLKESGIDPYPAVAERNTLISEAHKKFGELIASKKEISIAGRLISLRDQGNIIFSDLADESGEIQIVLKKDNLGEFKLWKSTLDIGDFISVTGPLFKTQKGEESVEILKLKILTKSLRPIPSERYGIEDPDTRLRKRYLEILTNSDTKEIFRKKSIFWQAIREYLLSEGYLEVETPVLENIPGGAEAEPFKTHHKALDVDFYMRISLELPLKKLLIAGYEKVFEIGRIFRNEGIDREHLQDYTQLEFYWSYADYNNMMSFVERLYKEVIKKTCGGLETKYDGTAIDWGQEWKTIDYVEFFEKENHINPVTATVEDLRKRAHALKLEPEKSVGKGRLIDLIFKHTARPKIIKPSFLIDPPVEIEPLAKRSRSKPGCVERFQVMAAGTELGKGFSELNDPQDQRARFEEQMKLREAGDTEAQRLDADFLEALEYGMPPAAGFGLSERLFAVLMNKPVRETVIFPLMRQKKTA
ncbi:MAG: lysine--tRNA ligase, partial [Patescibacteria group bacterium]